MVAFNKVISNRPFAGAVFYAVFLYLFEEWLFDFPQARFFQLVTTFMSGEEILIAFASGIASFLLVWWFVWVALTSSRTFQALYVILLGLASLVQYGFWKGVQRFLISADLRIAVATPIDTWKGAGSLFFDWRFILPVFGFTGLLFLFSTREKWKPSLTKLVTIFLSIVILVTVYTLTSGPLDMGVSFASFYQTIVRFVIDSMLPREREVINYHHLDTPRNNIVLVIDESIRGDHLSINGYDRKTTPFLSQLAHMEQGFQNFGLAVAGATCSYSSNALILTGVRPGVDEFEQTVSYPTVFQYAKAMGYKTYYMDAQTNSFWNGLTDQDLSSIDTWLTARDFGDDFQSDFRAADKIVEIVSHEPGNFIVLNKRGVHFLYEGSYPPEAAVWFPLPEDYVRNPSLVSNSYDNGVLFNVDTFFERLLIDPGILENTVILYTSDHGQTLFENNVSWLHCNSTLQEATVPLILIGRNMPPLMNPPHTHHSNILPTLLDLMAVPSSQRMHPYSPSLFSSDTKAWPKNQYFFDGSLQLIQFSDW